MKDEMTARDEEEGEMPQRDPQIGDHVIVGGPFSGSPGDQESRAWALDKNHEAGIEAMEKLLRDWARRGGDHPTARDLADAYLEAPKQ